MFTLTLSRHFGSTGGSWLHINVVINWQLSKQGIRWPVSPDCIAGSDVDPSRSSIFCSYPLTIYSFSNDWRLTFTFFKIHIKYVVFMSVSPRTIKLTSDAKSQPVFLKYRRGRPFLTIVTCWSRSKSNFYALIATSSPGLFPQKMGGSGKGPGIDWSRVHPKYSWEANSYATRWFCADRRE